MKKYLLLLCLTVFSSQIFANFIIQGHWRWRKDDGTETTATWLASENTAPTITSTDNVRLRVEFYNPQTDTLHLDNTTLAYSTTGADGTWITITDTSLNRDFALSKSPYVTSFQATTQQLTPRSGYTFQPGKIIDSQLPYIDSLVPNVVTEYEWVIKPTASARLDSTYYFETSILGYDKPLPTLKIGATLPVTLTGISVAQQDNKALVKWTTLNETNSDHFEVLRSADGQSWQTVTTVKAKGNSTTQSNYLITDSNPLTGNSYYRLRQYDKDGKIALSSVQPFILQLKGILASVYPNPTANAINVVLKNYSGTVTATVINSQGIIVHTEVIAASSATSSYRLNLNTKLPVGVYYINLSGNNFSQKAKVIVQ